MSKKERSNKANQDMMETDRQNQGERRGGEKSGNRQSMVNKGVKDKEFSEGQGAFIEKTQNVP